MGILDRIGAFKPSPVTGQPQSGGLLTGMAPAEALFARNVGGLLGRDMRTTEEKAQAELQAIDPRDPNAQIKSLEIVAKYGTPTQIADALGKIQTIQAGRQAAQKEKAEQERIDRFRGSLLKRSKELGLGEARQDTILNSGLEQLKEIRKELLAEEQAGVASSRGKAGKRTIAVQAGYRGKALEDVINLDSDNFSSVMSGLETSEEALKNISTGETDIYRVNKYGMIVDEGPEGNPVFTPINDQDLIPAPKETKDVGRANQLTTELAKQGVKSFTEVTEKARSAYRSLDVSRDRLKILEDNPNLITGGKLSELSTNVLITLASSLGITAPGTEDAEAAQLLIAQGVEEVGQTIKAFGAGTGLSDADREFAQIGAGATQELTAENIKRIVELRIEAADEAIRLHQGIYNTLKKEGASPASLAFYSVRPNLPSDLQQYYDD